MVEMMLKEEKGITAGAAVLIIAIVAAGMGGGLYLVFHPESEQVSSKEVGLGVPSSTMSRGGTPVCLEKAKDNIHFFLTPSYLPEGVKRDEIRVWSSSYRIYYSDNSPYPEVDAQPWWRKMTKSRVRNFISSGYNDVDPVFTRVNGNPGYIIEFGHIDHETGRPIPGTVCWFDNGIKYRVSGMLPAGTLMKMANSMYTKKDT